MNDEEKLIKLEKRILKIEQNHATCRYKSLFLDNRCNKKAEYESKGSFGIEYYCEKHGLKLYKKRTIWNIQRL